MNFKKPKDDVLNEARLQADVSFANMLRSSLPCGNFDRDSVISAVGQAVSWAMHDALKSLIDNIYTDADFEEDMNLRDKP